VGLRDCNRLPELLMPTADDNKSVWGSSYDWSEAGDEWSRAWGTAAMQWHGTLLPRIRSFLPAGTILEIAPGFGRWTQYLKEQCSNLFVVDLSEKCIERCRERFADSSHITFHVNDGTSLDMVANDSVDLIFSFDSLVHAEDAIMSKYAAEFSRTLRQDGVAFIHHSNLGEYATYRRWQSVLSKIPRLLGALQRLGVLDNVRSQWRDPRMSAAKMRAYAAENGLQCISQELVTWNTKRVLIDCISTMAKTNSSRAGSNRVLRNAAFMMEAQNLRKLARVYDPKSAK
jgi:ubiquinone/menaquinone biosynthesis C-methylase UbiE